MRPSAGVLALLAAVVLAACGPELTTPSDTDISGTWTSADTAAKVTDFVLRLSQADDGAISGSWSGRGIEESGTCPPGLGCTPTNGVTGSNTVFQVHIDLLGLGAFTGQIESDVHFRGHLGGAALRFRRAAEIQAVRAARGFP